MAFDNAKKKRGPGVPFAKGKPPGPGRPRGSRSRLSEAFLDAIYLDFAAHGAAAITAAREGDPLGYVKMVAGLLPTKIDVANVTCEMTDEELLAVIRAADRPVHH